ncbi:1-deoxy-D-xylulose-5-phosphate synthase [bacterium]|nr:1-deoxy-D-xylulose-5-phosphate synthase [bacterium]
MDDLRLELLDGIDSPADLKKLDKRQLPKLAAEIREFLLATLDETGGHFGANLGTVELIIALHYVFDSPNDAIVFDVGHQAYPHKILTGRRGGFSTLRMLDGMSGFLRRDESEHDIYGAGHASTALPAALGISAARSWDDKRWVVAVVGDGAMTGGLTLAGLNNSGLAKGRLLVVLNDNGMSIAPNVGTMSRYLSRLKARPGAQRLNRVLKRISGSLPLIRSHGSNLYDKLKKAVHYFWMPQAQQAIFDLLGFNYYGPFDGHNVNGLVSLLKMIKSWEPHPDSSPVLIHVVTEKGHGFKPAEMDPYKWHAAKPQTIKLNGRKTKKPSSTKSYTQVFAEALIEQFREYPEAVAITAAMPDGTGLDKVAAVYPSRVYDVGICEEFAVNFACGLAVAGKRPICAIYSTFLQRALDQLIHDVGIQKLPVIFALDRGGLAGADGETHQGVFDLTYLRMIPNFVVMAPKDENELRNMLKTALEYKGGPIAFRYPRGNALGVALDETAKPIPIGSWEVLREGGDVAILAVGHQVMEANNAAQTLAAEGTECTVVNCRFVKPMDEKLLRSIARKHGRIVTAEENVLKGGFGEGVLSWLAEHGFAPRVERIGACDQFIPHGGQAPLRARYNLDERAIADAVRRTSSLGKGRLEVVGG